VVQSSYIGVNEFLSLLAIIVSESLKNINKSDIFSQQHVTMVIYGLRGMMSNSAELCALITVLTSKIKFCTEPYNTQAVGNTLYGMQGMSSGIVEVRAMLSALIPKVESCRGLLDRQAIGNAVYGMQEMISDCAGSKSYALSVSA
jgi:hypothetical protein